MVQAVLGLGKTIDDKHFTGCGWLVINR